MRTGRQQNLYREGDVRRYSTVLVRVPPYCLSTVSVCTALSRGVLGSNEYSYSYSTVPSCRKKRKKRPPFRAPRPSVCLLLVREYSYSYRCNTAHTRRTDALPSRCCFLVCGGFYSHEVQYGGTITNTFRGLPRPHFEFEKWGPCVDPEDVNKYNPLQVQRK